MFSGKHVAQCRDVYVVGKISFYQDQTIGVNEKNYSSVLTAKEKSLSNGMGMHSHSCACVPCDVGREGRSTINRNYKGHGVINIRLKTLVICI